MKRRDENVHVMSGDRGIVAAVLLRALADVREGNPRLAAPAAAWIQREVPEDPFSFEWICESLDLSPAAVRRTVRHCAPMRHRPSVADDDERREEAEA